MAKKKTTKEVAPVTEMDVTEFEKAELLLKKPALAKDGTMLVEGNFSEIGKKAQALVEKYKGLELTETNVPFVQAVKMKFTNLRTQIERERKEYKKTYITSAGKLLDLMCDQLQEIVAEGENALQQQLVKYDTKRQDEIREVLQAERDALLSTYGITEQFSSLVAIKDRYFNKTQKEKDSIDDLEAQCKDALKKQEEYTANVALIESEVAGTVLLPSLYIDMLERLSVAEILLKIRNDKKEAQEVYEDVKKAEEKGEPYTVGENISFRFGDKDDGIIKECTPFTPSKDKTEHIEEHCLVMEIRYKKGKGKELSDFLKANGFSYTVLQATEVQTDEFLLSKGE